MNVEDLEKGDAIYAAVPIINDGSVPYVAKDQLFAEPGTLGMLLNIGHLEEDPEQVLYLVSFEMPSGELGPPVACLADELSVEPLNRA